MNRGFFSTLAKETGVPLLMVQKQSDHSTLAAVQVYLHSTKDQKVEAIRKLAL